MKKIVDPSAEPRTPLTKERVLRAAVALADEDGIESLSMRKLAQELGVEAMSLYNHVANKEDILDGMVGVIVSEIHAPSTGADWKTIIRQRAIAAREVLKRHPWAPGVIESRTNAPPTMIRFIDSTLGIFREGGFSIDLAHHALHAMGSRLLGFTQELFESDDADQGPAETAAIFLRQMAGEYPNIAEMLMEISHDKGSIVGPGCDDQFEFEFGLELMLDGLERLLDRESAGG